MASIVSAANSCVDEALLASDALPVVFLSHGGGPGFLLADPNCDVITFLAKTLPASLPRPAAIVVVSAHWEEQVATVITAPAKPGLLYDYYGFPPETYAPHLTYDAGISAPVAARVQELLATAGIPARTETKRGFDHGVFIPLKVVYPLADIPIVQVSLLSSLDPAAHYALGAALAPLRHEGVLIVGSGFVTHNMQERRMHGAPDKKMTAFTGWLQETLALPTAEARRAALLAWTAAPHARYAHPREEHFIPVLVCAGAAGADAGARVFSSWMGSFGLHHYVFGRTSLPSAVA